MRLRRPLLDRKRIARDCAAALEDDIPFGAESE
jgi:hypothetical protein